MILSSHTERKMLVVSGEWVLCIEKQMRGVGWETGLRQAWITSSGKLVHPCYVQRMVYQTLEASDRILVLTLDGLEYLLWHSLGNM